jgi:predicted MFS family arabinose efflux permease
VEQTAISALLLKVLLVPMVGLWVFHMYQRRFKAAAERKRIATLSLTAVIIGAWVAAWLFNHYGVADIYLVAVAAAAVAVVIWQRKLMWPYRLKCRQCGKPLGLMRVLSIDSNKCEACEPPRTEGRT